MHSYVNPLVLDRKPRLPDSQPLLPERKTPTCSEVQGLERFIKSHWSDDAADERAVLLRLAHFAGIVDVASKKPSTRQLLQLMIAARYGYARARGESVQQFVTALRPIVEREGYALPERF